mmetsp:Transcript_29375/g.84097  ORF Transcript_29375/g.84097 Transcript_29375/m.84097 type:complete len:112 (+) Transcript_29375:59-394(+)
MFSGISSFARGLMGEARAQKVEFDTPPPVTRRLSRTWTSPSMLFDPPSFESNDDTCNPLRCRTGSDARRSISKESAGTEIWARCDKSNLQIAQERAEVLARYNHRYDRYHR